MKNNILAPVFLVFLVFLPFYQTLSMYFWQDDYTHLYYAQKGQLFYFPYQTNTLIVRSLLPFFGFDHWKYALLGIIFYATACLLFFYLLKNFLRQYLAFLGTIIMASGYVGENAIKTIVNEFAALLGLNTALLTLISLVLFLQKSRKRWLGTTIIFYFLTLEIAPQRFMGVLPVLFLLTLFFPSKQNTFSKVFLGSFFSTIFYLQYFIHPLKNIIGYDTGFVTKHVNLAANLTSFFLPESLESMIATFWNLFFPSFLQDQIYLLIKSYHYASFTSYWLTAIPVVVLAIFVLIRQKRSAFIITFAASLLWSLLFRETTFLREHVYTMNGGFLAILFLTLAIHKKPNDKNTSLFCIAIIMILISTLWIAKPNTTFMNSDHRYFITLAFIPAFLIPFLHVSGKSTFFITIAALILSSLKTYSALKSQSEFRQNNSFHAQTIFQSLPTFIPKISSPTLIYIEGATSNLNYSVSDAQRVGVLPSEASFAVHYQTTIDQIILPEFLEDIPSIINEESLPPENIHTFIYDGQKLTETTPLFLELITHTPPPTNLSDWVSSYNHHESTLSLVPKSAPSSLLPLFIKLRIKGPQPIKIEWQYDTAGAQLRPKYITVASFQTYEFTIPAGGTYLKNINLTIPADISNLPLVTQLDISYNLKPK